MPEKLIPCSKRQHDAINATVAEIKQQQSALSTYCNAILAAQEEDFGQVGIKGAVCIDGVYSLRIEVPDIAPKSDAPAQADVA